MVLKTTINKLKKYPVCRIIYITDNKCQGTKIIILHGIKWNKSIEWD